MLFPKLWIWMRYQNYVHTNEYRENVKFPARNSLTLINVSITFSMSVSYLPLLFRSLALMSLSFASDEKLAQFRKRVLLSLLGALRNCVLSKFRKNLFRQK